MTDLADICKSIIAAGEKATERPWLYGPAIDGSETMTRAEKRDWLDSCGLNENSMLWCIHSPSSEDEKLSFIVAVTGDTSGSEGAAAYLATAANHADKLARKVLELQRDLEAARAREERLGEALQKLLDVPMAVDQATVVPGESPDDSPRAVVNLSILLSKVRLAESALNESFAALAPQPDVEGETP